MNNQVRQVQVRAVLPLEGSFAVFLGDKSKTFVIYVDESVGTAISMFMRGSPKERPLTHDLLGLVMQAFGASVDRIVINDVQGSIFYARMILSAENQLGAKKVVELDARPSDSIAMALHYKAPVFVAERVWATVEDVTSTLEEIQKRGLEHGGAATDEDSSTEADDDDSFAEDDDNDEEDDDDFDFEFDDEDDEDDDDKGDDRPQRPDSSTY